MKMRILMLGSILAGILWFPSCRSTDHYDHYAYTSSRAYPAEGYGERAYAGQAVPAVPTPYTSPGYQGQGYPGQDYQAQGYPSQGYDNQNPEPPPLEESAPAYQDQPAEQPVMGEVPGSEPPPAPAEQPYYPPPQDYSSQGKQFAESPYPYQGSGSLSENQYAAESAYAGDRYREDRYDRYDYERRPSISYDDFYNRLSPYGDWVRHRHYGWVWCPRGISVGWRPYAVGHWVWTDDYGWLWDSDEQWGWATYHYGRWACDSDYGWCWVPGYTWAPAWVIWRHSPRYVGWAPIPPAVSVSFHMGFHLDYHHCERYIRPYDWCFIGQRDFCERDYSRHIVSPYGNTVIINNTTNITNYTIVNNHIVNKSVQVNEIERMANKRVPKYQVSRTDTLVAHGNVRDNKLQVFAPSVRTDTRTKEPPRDVISRSDPGSVKARHSRSEQAFRTVMNKETQEIRSGKRPVDAPAPELVSVPDNVRRSKREPVKIPAGGAGRVLSPGARPATASAPSAPLSKTGPVKTSVTAPPAGAAPTTGQPGSTLPGRRDERTSRRPTLTTPPAATGSTAAPSITRTSPGAAAIKSPQGKSAETPSRAPEAQRVIIRPSRTSAPEAKVTPGKTEIKSMPPQSNAASQAATRPPASSIAPSRREPIRIDSSPRASTPPPTSMRPENRSTAPTITRTGPAPVVRPSADQTPRIEVRPLDTPPTASRPPAVPDSSRSRAPSSRPDNAPDFRSFRDDRSRGSSPSVINRPDYSRSSNRPSESKADYRTPPTSSRSYAPPSYSRGESRPSVSESRPSLPPTISRSESRPPVVEMRRPTVSESKPSSPPPSISRSESRPSEPERVSRSESARSDSGSSSRGKSDSDSDKGSSGNGRGRGK